MYKIVVVILLAIVATEFGYLSLTNDRYSEKRITYDMCQESRINNNISEQTCADLQDWYGLKYSCDARNNYIENHCQVKEIKNVSHDS